MALTGITNRCLGTMGYEINNKLSRSVESQTTGRRDMSQYQVNLAIAMQSEFSSAKTQGAIQNVRIATEFLRTTDTNLRTTLASLQGATLSAMTLLNGTVSADNKKAAVSSLIQTMGMIQDPQTRADAEGTLVKTLRQGGTYYSLTTGDLDNKGTTITPAAPSNGLAGFSLNPASNFGAGKFTLGYDGEYVTFKDATFGDTMAVVPLATKTLEEATARAAAAVAAGKANATVPVSLGNVGTLQIGEGYTVKGGVSGGASFAAAEYSFTTTTDPLKAVVTVSGNDGTRTLELPVLTDPAVLWGDVTAIDRTALENEDTYQLKIKSRVDHASGVVTKAIQDVNNLLQALTEDETGQVATLESLKNTYDTVATADPIETANAVFVETQKYMQMLSAVALVSQVSAQERSAANQIAQLATGG